MEPSRSEAREQAGRSVRDALKKNPDRWRRAAPNVVYSLIAASALAPVAMTLGSDGLAVATALATAVGGVGTNLVSEFVSNTIETARQQDGGEDRQGPEDPGGPAGRQDAVADAIARELTGALDRNDATARQLVAQVTAVVDALGGFEAAFAASPEKLHDHLLSSLQAAAQGNSQLLGMLAGIRNEQRRQRALLEEGTDLLRTLSRPGGPGPSGGPSPSAPTPVPVIPVFASVPPSVPQAEAPLAERWRAGEEGRVGGRRYLLVGDQDGLLREEHAVGGERVRRQALARQTFPSPPAYAWLRQAGHGLTRERDWPRSAREADGARGLPAVVHYDVTAGTVSLALSWPTGRDGRPRQTLRSRFPPGTLDEWRVRLLLTGLGGLVCALERLHALDASHRNLAPEAIVVVSDSEFALRDAGLAPVGFRPGEALGDYQAPEQAFGARGMRAGPATDVYQLAAIAYHLISGRIPAAAGRVPPLRRSVIPGPAVAALTASLDRDPGRRPAPQELGTVLLGQR